METQKGVLLRPVVVDSHHFDVEPNSDPYLSEKRCCRSGKVGSRSEKNHSGSATLVKSLIQIHTEVMRIRNPAQCTTIKDILRNKFKTVLLKNRNTILSLLCRRAGQWVLSSLRHFFRSLKQPSLKGVRSVSRLLLSLFSGPGLF